MQVESVDSFIDDALQSQSVESAAKLAGIIYGQRPEEVLHSDDLNCELRIHRFQRSNASTRLVRIAGIQMRYPGDTATSVQQQLHTVHERVHNLLEICGQAKVNIVCLQETWRKEKEPWTEFAECAESGPSFQVVSKQAAKHQMVIVSPILERDTESKVIWNTAVVVDENGKFLGKSRKNHIPRVGDFNEVN
ncbi:hypothetical protein Ciccas_012107 [Cichlidogyrus casuarinus]|uniref:CN hydrolase domain-containing protein n=1 Tax=Cichlidogyrus casuarinus TaxID=1844966 RepID=A0ABD2PQQ9_9PLAT